ncbi:MAG: hypothetical protein AAF488_08080 [Planctomycetota bacterium]
MVRFRRFALVLALTVAPVGISMGEPVQGSSQAPVFDAKFPKLDSLAVGEWWKRSAAWFERTGVQLDVPRDQTVAFALYAHDNGELKLTAQLFPLRPGEVREARLEIAVGSEDAGAPGTTWREVARAEVLFPGWSAHFRVEGWDSARTVAYRVRHGEKAVFRGTIRRDPIDQNEIVVGVLSCNSSRTTGPRATIVENLRHQDPDLLFFAGDQTYRHTEHTAGWIEFGLQFREVLRDRPVVTIPDDHDVGQNNLWGEAGGRATSPAAPEGGYHLPLSYVNMVERQQTWHLPGGERRSLPSGLKTYYTRLRLGGIDFAILEDRKFKTGPLGTIPKMGPRPDHIVDPEYDPKAVDLPELALLGEDQIAFLGSWADDWRGAHLKCVLSQTAFCGAVHLHGTPKNRVIADLDCNGWPQTGRNRALRLLRRASALHLCGDQHLAVVVKHGIEQHRDGPFGFTAPAIVNTIYGRWWRPADEKAGGGAPIPSVLPWVGDYLDGLANRITVWAYANPENRRNERKRADGYGLVRFDKQAGTATLECWPRFASVKRGDSQFPGWPITVSMSDNDSRTPTHVLDEIPGEAISSNWVNPVVRVTRDDSGEVLYTRRLDGSRQPKVFGAGRYTVEVGDGRPSRVVVRGAESRPIANEKPKR